MSPADNIARQIGGLPCRELLISNVDIIRGRTIRIETNLMRSNGTYVDLFIDVTEWGVDDFKTIIVSDFGTTWDYIIDLGKSLSQSSLEYIAESYGLQLDGHALSKTCTMRNFLQNVLAVAQACVVMSSPGLFERTRMFPVTHARELVPTISPTPSTVVTVVEALTQSRRPFNQDVSIKLREDYEVQVDILVEMPRHRAALMVVEHSPYGKVTMRRADHAFAIHTDLKEARWRGTRLSIVDELDFQRERNTDSFIRLGRISRLISTSDLQKEDLGIES
jgi:hypothetical protein